MYGKQLRTTTKAKLPIHFITAGRVSATPSCFFNTPLCDKNHNNLEGTQATPAVVIL